MQFRNVLRLLLVLVSGVLARAQVTLEMTTDQTQFLPAEKLSVTVRIVNLSGRTLKLATEPDWLLFSVESIGGGVVAKYREVPVEGEFDVESAARASFKVDIAPHFDLNQAGRYRINAQMSVPSLNKVVTAEPIVVEVLNGSQIWSATFGLPGSAGDTSVPEQRRYLLQQVTHLKQLRLYVRVTDEKEGHTYRVFPIGTMASLTKPQAVVDRQSRLHVIHQYDARAYTYHLVNHDGEVLVRQTHQIGESRPSLRMNESGEVSVVGGARRRTSADIPAEGVPVAEQDHVEKKQKPVE